MYVLSFYVPFDHLESVKEALFLAGAGQIGNYDRCCWQTKGEGQFRPNDGSNPYLGTQDELMHVEEYKVELLCHSGEIKKVIKALKKSHPYETPAYHVVRISRF